jgi:hypothetical protein
MFSQFPTPIPNFQFFAFIVRPRNWCWKLGKIPIRNFQFFAFIVRPRNWELVLGIGVGVINSNFFLQFPIFLVFEVVFRVFLGFRPWRIQLFTNLDVDRRFSPRLVYTAVIFARFFGSSGGARLPDSHLENNNSGRRLSNDTYGRHFRT